MYHLSISLTFLVGVCFFFESNFILAQDNREVLKTETCWSYSIENNVPASKGSLSRQVEYNDEGKKIKEISYTEKGAIVDEYFFDYKSNTRETYWKLSDGTKIKSETEVYNNAGQLLERILYNTDGKLRNRTEIVYKNGTKRKERYFNASNEIIYTVNCYPNEERKTSIELCTNDKGEEEIRGAITLDEDGLLKTYEKYTASGPLIQSIVYERDEEGRILVKKTAVADGTVELKEVFEYTENAKYYSAYTDEGTKLVEHVVYKYNYYQNK